MNEINKPTFRQKLMPYIPLILILLLIALIINIILFAMNIMEAQDIARLLEECNPVKICGHGGVTWQER